MPDLITLMAFESGELDDKELVEMISEMIQQEGYESLDGKYKKLARQYINKNILDEEGDINYIKLKEEFPYA